MLGLVKYAYYDVDNDDFLKDFKFNHTGGRKHITVNYGKARIFTHQHIRAMIMTIADDAMNEELFDSVFVVPLFIGPEQYMNMDTKLEYMHEDSVSVKELIEHYRDGEDIESYFKLDRRLVSNERECQS